MIIIGLGLQCRFSENFVFKAADLGFILRCTDISEGKQSSIDMFGNQKAASLS